MDFFNAIKDDPMLLGAAVAVMASFGWGVKLIWGAFVAMAVRALDQVAADHSGDRKSLVQKARDLDDTSTPRRKVESLMMSRMPNAVIDAAIAKREGR